MNSTDTITFLDFGFDPHNYFVTQTKAILERINKFKHGRLYLEIGGKFLFDPHAARVLPGFNPYIKKEIFSYLKYMTEIIFCIDAESIVSNRQLKNTNETYQDVAINMAKEIENNIGLKPFIAINRCSGSNIHKVIEFQKILTEHGFESYKRYVISGYPDNTELILSQNGYAKDEYIPVSKKLILVTGAASNSGKMSTCLGQIYHEHLKGHSSGYAKYETFPIWNLSITHPVNLAYEAATADIGDYNVIDTYHQQAYGKVSVNYNRDVDAFKILKLLGEKFVDENNFIRSYKSPTDMGINTAGFSITIDELVCRASLDEIKRRKDWYQQVISRNQGNKIWIDICIKLQQVAELYMHQHGYSVKSLH